ncbi:MAG: hypothetical protein M3Y57_06755, partial [Acidobacteriota bacterium]|nr:hypothetical protein [Acidobacteriota bacterium]
HVSENAPAQETTAADSGFVPQPRKYSAAAEAHWAESVKYGDVAFDDYELKDLLAADLDHHVHA